MGLFSSICYRIMYNIKKQQKSGRSYSFALGSIVTVSYKEILSPFPVKISSHQIYYFHLNQSSQQFVFFFVVEIIYFLNK